MTYNIIKTDNYLLVVDDKETETLIAKGALSDYCLNIGGLIKQSVPFRPAKEVLSSGVKIRKIIAHLPLNNAPVLEGVDLLPPLEDDVDETAYNWLYYNEESLPEGFPLTPMEYGFVNGYEKAKEKYKWTDEDMKKAIIIAKNAIGVDNDGETCYSHLSANDIIQSLSQPKLPVKFECEIEKYDGTTSISKDWNGKPKTITTRKGKQWVGKYIY